MAIDTKLNTVENGVSGIRDAIQNINSNMGKGHINTLDDDIEKLSNQNNFIHKVLKQAVTETTIDPDTEEETTEVIGYNYVNQSEYVGPNYTAIPASKYTNNTELSEVIIPDSVTSIGNSTFYNCTNLKYINLVNIKSIVNLAFRYTTNLKIDLDLTNATSIGNSAFANSGILSIKLPTNITTIINEICWKCKNLIKIEFPINVLQINDYAFSECSKLEDCKIPSTIKRIYQRAFYQSSYKEDLNLPNLETIGYQAFSITNLKNVIDLGIITSLPIECFAKDYSLETVNIPTTIKSINGYCFWYCNKLKTITILAETPPSLTNTVFNNTNSTFKIYVPYSEDHSILAAYQAATNWTSYSSRIHELNPDGSIPT